MGCNSDYMEATGKEIGLSQVACLLDELDGKPFNRSYWEGYHPSVYNKNIDGDKLVSSLCSKLQKLNVTQYSLEMQMWWRDHQEADNKRIEKEIKMAEESKAKEEALAKLSDYERQLLGV